MNIVELSDRLTSDPELIIKVLIRLGFDVDKIVYHRNQRMITSVRPEDGANNPHGFIIYTDSLHYLFTTRSGEGNIYQLIMNMRDVSFPEALQLIAKWIGFKGSDIKIVRPFGGFYRKLLHSANDDLLDTDLPVYDEADLPDVSSGVSEYFFNDGISFQVQEDFGIRFDHDENAILIPIRNSNGELVGCKARNNDRNCDMSQRYWAKLPFQKTHVVYGLDHNYKHIAEKNMVIIVESEKAVMQAASFGCNICLAIMGHILSNTQARLIKSLMVKKVIFAADEGISEDDIVTEAKKLVIDTQVYKNNVFYLFGGLREGSKDSPTDCGKEVFQRLMRENLRRIDSG